MHQFKDNAGRTWQININVATVKRVRSLCGINILDAIKINEKDVNTDILTQLSEDPVLLVDVLYALCMDQAQAAGVSDTAFGEAQTGETIEQATEALLQDLCDFFPAAKRSILRTVLASASRIKAKAEQATQRILQNGDLERELAKLEESTVSE